MSDIAYVALGSNIGDRERHLRTAREALAALPDSRIRAASAIEETAPLGGLDQPPYLNQMVALETQLSPGALLAELQRIERESGRTRESKWASRTLDLDIVLFDEQAIREPGLQVPHPALPERDFWQRELADLRARL